MINYQLWDAFGPVAWIFWGLLGAFATMRHAPKFARRVLAATLLWLTLLALTPFGTLLILPLEDRFPVLAGTDPGRIDDIVVLAGGEALSASRHAHGPEYSSHGERVTDGAALALAHPNARLTIAGGVRESGYPTADIDIATATWRSLGIPANRIRRIDHTRDTAMNALGLAAVPHGRVLLVTSAFHMPRAVASFRAAGIEPVPDPVDFQTPPVRRFADMWPRDPLGNVARTDLALHEWIGLAYYRLSGRTRELFPAPKAASGRATDRAAASAKSP